MTAYSDNLPVNKEAGAVCSALTNQWPALIADTNFKIYLGSFSLSCSVVYDEISPLVLFLTTWAYDEIFPPHLPHLTLQTLLVLKWLLLCHYYYYYCRQTRLSKTSKIINYEDWDWSLAGQVTKTPEMLRQNVFTVKYRVETRDILYPDKSLLIGCSCHPLELDIPHPHCIVWLVQPSLTLQHSFTSVQCYFKSHRATATFINQVKLWPS